MHSSTVFVASVALLTSFVNAEAERPRYYYPRQIKRQIFVNSTVTSQQPAIITSDGSSSSSTKRQISDFFNGLVGPGTGTSGISPTEPPSAASTPDSVTTIIISQTTIFDPSEATATPADTDPTSIPVFTLPSLTDLFPTPISSGDLLPTLDLSSLSASDLSDALSGSAVTFGPGGVISSSSSESATAPSTTAEGVTSGISFSGSAGPTDPPAPSSTEPPLISAISSLVSEVSTDLASVSSELPITLPTETPTADPPITLPTELPTALPSDLPASSELPVTLPTAEPTIEPTALPTALPTEILPTVIPSEVSSPIPIPTDTLPTVIPSEISSLLPTPTDVPIPTITPEPTLPPEVSSIISEVSSALPTDPITVPVTSIPDVTGGESSTAISTGVPVETPPPASETEVPPVTVPTTDPVITAPPATTTDPGSVPTATPSDGSSLLTTGGDIVPTGVPTTAIEPTSEAPSAAVTSSAELPLSAVPTATDTGTSMWLPPSIIAASSATVAPGEETPTAAPLPTNLPQVITPPSGVVTAPEDSTMVQIGFLYPLNYQFVVNNPISSAQIFAYLPQGIARGLGLKDEQIVMNSLVPLNTSQQLGYTTTLAMLHVPANMVNTLGLNLLIPTSAIYDNPDASVNTLVNYINPAIPLQPGSNLAGGAASGTGSGSAATSTAANGNSGIFNTDTQNTTPKVTGTTAAIALSAVGGAAAYGAAMFLIARRYKKRKQSHRRSRSVMTPSEMRQSAGTPALLGGGAFMSGGRITPESTSDRNSRGSGRSAGNSARTQQISGPMMAENSLGWN